MDIAFQAAPDHPYVNEHENWFRKRPDGTIQYAENPPKKYQDIYPFDFESEDWAGMWEELKSGLPLLDQQGVTIFRVDNPHTKAFPFWEWVIAAEIKRDHPEVLFLAEAFTRPKIMYRLAKLGFSQSYTYFPWRNGKAEITAYLTELAQTPVREFFRPNQWPNTPDILTEFLQIGGRAAFRSACCWPLRWARTTASTARLRAAGACAGQAGSEEYLNSEKYEIRHWDLESARQPASAHRAGSTPSATAMRRCKATGRSSSIPLTTTRLICYSKESDDRSNLHSGGGQSRSALHAGGLCNAAARGAGDSA
jgi:starch synthase (maltosyl-transferring)